MELNQSGQITNLNISCSSHFGYSIQNEIYKWLPSTRSRFWLTTIRLIDMAMWCGTTKSKLFSFGTTTKTKQHTSNEQNNKTNFRHKETQRTLQKAPTKHHGLLTTRLGNTGRLHFNRVAPVLFPRKTQKEQRTGPFSVPRRTPGRTLLPLSFVGLQRREKAVFF